MEYNPVGWFEISVEDIDRAVKFYESLFEVKLQKNEASLEFDMRMFPYSEDKMGISGSLVKGEMFKPSQSGTLVYFTTPSGDLNADAKKIEELGGKIVMPRTSIGEHGFIVIFIDTEGNKVALHSRT